MVIRKGLLQSDSVQIFNHKLAIFSFG